MKCPYCGAEATCDTVDIGVGEIQCGPYGCDYCEASQNKDGTWSPPNYIVCGPCSRAGGADRPVMHLPPECKDRLEPTTRMDTPDMMRKGGC